MVGNHSRLRREGVRCSAVRALVLALANNGLASDLDKWKDVKGDGEVVLVCQITMHDGTYDESLPETWQSQFDEIAKEHKRISRSVGYEIPGTDEKSGKDRVRWAHFDAFIVNPG